ncbi:excalibur calcium-binding domain-containing protein [[Mycobacterium] kokjensenii]|uniref:Excalibur calcium-binding domain-containing protein n=1 Tax=[Mycobacterium] kokjensenii TaxID=3064287 RepID=A0ABN9MV63_9MYCO|nr:excalibur calcium-binding domain-containing protein [Mycolicibacter sp. MU0083]CAJ1493790.1 excalibur calcium-binding domain-containing protein [Mycolicibacter sp. MU0083]
MIRRAVVLAGLAACGAGIALAPVAAADPYYKNCTAAREAGAAPLYEGDPGYRTELDRDGDGIACEPKR